MPRAFVKSALIFQPFIRPKTLTFEPISHPPEFAKFIDVKSNDFWESFNQMRSRAVISTSGFTPLFLKTLQESISSLPPRFLSRTLKLVIIHELRKASPNGARLPCYTAGVVMFFGPLLQPTHSFESLRWDFREEVFDIRPPQVRLTFLHLMGGA